MSAHNNLYEAYAETSPCGLSKEEILLFAKDVAPMSDGTAKLLRLVDDPDASIDTITDVVSKDAGLVGSMLKLANSPTFAQRGKVVTIANALGVVGIRSLKSLVVAKMVTGLNRYLTAADRMVRDHSLGTALLLRDLSHRLGRRDADEMFLCGMMHRLGHFVFLSDSRTRTRFMEVLARIREQSEDYTTAEVAEIGFAHTIIGALVANRWNFPAEMSQIILHYNDIFEGVDCDLDRKTFLVKFASAAATAAKIGVPAGYPDQLPMLQELGVPLGVLRSDSAETDLQEIINGLTTSFASESQIWAAG